jgi:phytoene dehydrogenase-like protein
MEEKPIIIIGAGLAGLSAGCYGRMNGYRTLIFEMHDKAGGVCTGLATQGLHHRRCDALRGGHQAGNQLLQVLGRAWGGAAVAGFQS